MEAAVAAIPSPWRPLAIFPLPFVRLLRHTDVFVKRKSFVALQDFCLLPKVHKWPTGSRRAWWEFSFLSGSAPFPFVQNLKWLLFSCSSSLADKWERWHQIWHLLLLLLLPVVKAWWDQFEGEKREKLLKGNKYRAAVPAVVKGFTAVSSTCRELVNKIHHPLVTQYQSKLPQRARDV